MQHVANNVNETLNTLHKMNFTFMWPCIVTDFFVI